MLFTEVSHHSSDPPSHNSPLLLLPGRCPELTTRECLTTHSALLLQSFDELLELAEAGDHRSVDMLVKDIYGGDYSSLGLQADVIASSFGKATRLDGLCPTCLGGL